VGVIDGGEGGNTAQTRTGGKSSARGEGKGGQQQHHRLGRRILREKREPSATSLGQKKRERNNVQLRFFRFRGKQGGKTMAMAGTEKRGRLLLGKTKNAPREWALRETTGRLGRKQAFGMLPQKGTEEDGNGERRAAWSDERKGTFTFTSQFGKRRFLRDEETFFSFARGGSFRPGGGRGKMTECSLRGRSRRLARSRLTRQQPKKKKKDQTLREKGVNTFKKEADRKGGERSRLSGVGGTLLYHKIGGRKGGGLVHFGKAGEIDRLQRPAEGVQRWETAKKKEGKKLSSSLSKKEGRDFDIPRFVGRQLASTAISGGGGRWSRSSQRAKP